MSGGEDAKPKKPVLVWRTCESKCLDCPQCGYFVGPGHEDENKRGKWPWWRTR